MVLWSQKWYLIIGLLAYVMLYTRLLQKYIYIYIYILPAIISDTQSALLYGRLTNNNVLVVFEIMHHIKQKK